MARLVFLVCHLTGTGHFVRTIALASAAAARGHDVCVLSGGRPLAYVDTSNVRVVQIPPIFTQGLSFTDLRQPDGRKADDAYLVKRAGAIAAVLEEKRPDVLVTELFPFGRRVLRGEFLAAVMTARNVNPDVRILCSVRDIPEPKPERLDETSATLRRHFDGVLVHGDPQLVPLWSTWALPADLRPRVHHTGYVARSVPDGAAPYDDTILVSTGGGALGRRLLAIAVQAASVSERDWHILVGGRDADTVIEDLGPRPTGTRIEPARPDFTTLLAQAACSVSLAGYNTAVEVARSTTPALLVPSAEAGEQEQTLRATAFAAQLGIVTAPLATLTSDELAKQADALARGPRRTASAIRADDGTGTIKAIEAIIAT